MAIVYKNVPYRFDVDLWAAFCEQAAKKHGLEDIAELIDVHPTTLKGWIKKLHKMGFEHPSMSNFLKLCNLMDTNPDQFFTIQDE